MDLGWSGFTPAGYPKAVTIALADHVEKNNLQGQLKFNLFIGASVGAETENRWAELDMIDRRWPYQTGKNIAKGINEGRIRIGRQTPVDVRPGSRVMVSTPRKSISP